MKVVISRKLNILLISIFMLLGSSCLSAHEGSSKKPKRQGWVFVQSATSGSLKRIEGDPDHYRLTLKGVSPSMIAFTDRPARKGRVRTVSAFIHRWKTHNGRSSYRKSPPNASLVLSSRGFEDIIVVSLKNPKYNAKKQLLSYKLKFIQLINNHRDRNLQVPLRRVMPENFQKVVLFIDDSWNSLGG